MRSAHVSPGFLAVVSFFQTHSYSRTSDSIVAALCEGIKNMLCGASAADLLHQFGFVCIVVLSTSIFPSWVISGVSVQMIEDILKISFILNNPFNPDITTL